MFITIKNKRENKYGKPEFHVEQVFDKIKNFFVVTHKTND